MAKNTGKGSRSGAVSGRSQVKSASVWIKRDSASGRFMQAKQSGGAFKGVRKEK